MTTIKKILFPTDFSSCAQNAFKHALIFADKMNASLDVLHVVFPETAPLDVPVVAVQPTRQRMETAKEVISQFVDFCISEVKTTHDLKAVPKVETKVEIGTLNNVINQVVDEKAIDLIIMGTRGKHNLLEKLFGSHSSSTISKAPCHVLVIPEKANLDQIETIAYASDLSTADPFHIWEMGKMLNPFHPVIKCVHVQTQKNEQTELKLQELMDFFENRAPALQISFHKLEGTDMVKRLNQFINDWGVDMLVMFAPHKTIWDKIFFVSNTQKMAFYTEVPLLVLKEK